MAFLRLTHIDKALQLCCIFDDRGASRVTITTPELIKLAAYVTMVVINLAYTQAINPEDASPVLSRSQIWKGLQRKIRQAQDFVPVIESTDVLEDKDGTVTRVAHFKATDSGPAHEVREVCKEFAPCRVDFWQPNGSVITNICSNGPSLAEKDFQMTYAFEWRHPEVQEGSEEHKAKQQQYLKMAQMAVDSSIKAMREMAKRGELD